MNVTSKLAAIMFTDIAGYTFIMGSNETKAMELLHQNRSLQKPLIEQYGGIWHKEMGDGVLASFDSAYQAVKCAIDIQELATGDLQNKIRIGIHLGEVIIEGGDVLGDGVNIASRIEPLAPNGGIYISESVYQSIQSKAEIHAEFVKEASLKNVKQPIKLYQVKTGNEQKSVKNQSSRKGKLLLPLILAIIIACASVFLLWNKTTWFQNFIGVNMMVNQEEEKSIAVLPIKYLSEDQTKKYHAAGVTSSIIGHLSNIEGLRVISELSVEPYNNTKKNANEIANELGVRYLLLGNYLFDGKEVILNTHLVDKEGNQLFFEEYKIPFTEIMTTQSTIARTIADRLNIQLSRQAKRSVEKSLTQNIEAYDYYVQGHDHLVSYLLTRNSEDFANAEFTYQQALKYDLNFAKVYVDLAQLYAWNDDKINYPWDTVNYLVEKALNLDKNLAEGYFLKGWLFYVRRQGFEKAIRELEHSISLNPNHAWSHYMLGSSNRELQNWEEAAKYYKKTMQLEKGSPMMSMVYEDIGTLHLRIGDFEEALAYFDRSFSIQPYSVYTYIPYYNSLLALGRFDDAIELSRRFYEKDQNMAYAEQAAISLSILNRFVDSNEYWEQAIALTNTHHGNALNEEFRYAYVLWNLGNEKKARKIFRNQIARFEKELDNSAAKSQALYNLAAIKAFLNEKEESFEYLKQLGKTDFPPYLASFMKYDPLFEPIQGSDQFVNLSKNRLAEFAEIIERIGQLE